MEENIIFDESSSSDDNNTADKDTCKLKHKVSEPENKSKYRQKKCTVIAYNKGRQTLDVKFDRFGIRFNHVKNFSEDAAIVKYRGEIGKPDFECKL